MLLEDVLVIAMGQTALTPGSGSQTTEEGDKKVAASAEAASFLVTVAVTPKDAARLIHGINTGELYAALRGEELKMADAPRVDDLNIFDLKSVGR